MGNISHLVGGGPAQSNAAEADQMNSIVERITGVNPSKLAAKVTGAEVNTNFAPGSGGGGPRALQVARQQMQPQSQGYLPGQHSPQSGQAANPDMRAMMERMSMLEQKVAFYEQDKDPEKYQDKTARGPSNRGPESRIWGRDIDPKKAKEKDPADGKPDSQEQNATKEHMMSNDVRDAIGSDLNEWKKLAGLTDPYSGESYVNLAQNQGRGQLYEDVYEEGDDATAPAAPAAPAPPKPGVSRKVGKAMAGMIKGLGKGAAGVAKRAMSSSVEQDFRNEMWEAFLHDRGLSTDVFNALIDEALESDDAEEMDALLAVEEVFERLMAQAVEHYDNAPVEESYQESAPAPGVREWFGFLEAHDMDPYDFDETVKLAEEVGEDYILGLCQEVVYIFEASSKARGGGTTTDAGAQKIAKINKELKNFKSVGRDRQGVLLPLKRPKPSDPAGKEDPRKWPKQMGLADDTEEDFEVDATEDGEPDGSQIPWSKIVKSYSSKSKEERGFGGMSRSGV